MSIKIYGNIPKKSVATINSTTYRADVPVTIKSYLNRKTKASTLKLYLKARNGKFDRGLWQPPLVAELPNGERKLFDGDHRRALWHMAYPTKPAMPAQIVPVRDEAAISRLFVAINKTARKSLSANEVFVHEVLGGDMEAYEVSNHLTQCRLKVGLGTGEEGSFVGSRNSPEININGFRTALRETSAVTVRSSSMMIQQLWPKDNSIQVELLGGLARIYKNKNKIPAQYVKTFEDFLDARKNADVSQKEVATSFKIKGGNIVNHSETCIALGLLQKYKHWATVNKKMSIKTFKKYYGDLEAAFEKELDT